MTDAERLKLRQLHTRVSEETLKARGKFDTIRHNLEEVDLAYGLGGLVEEVGKLHRTFNKLRIATDSTVVAQWRTERDHRFVTCLSMLERLYLASRERDR